MKPTFVNCTFHNLNVVPISDREAEESYAAWLADGRPFIDVRDFGAILDGKSDDVDAIDAAFLHAEATGGKVLIPPGSIVAVSRSFTIRGKDQFLKDVCCVTTTPQAMRLEA